MSLVEPASVSHEYGAEEELKAASEHKEGQQQPAAKGAAKADKDAKAAAGEHWQLQIPAFC
jgi:hypothetical protein